MKLTVFVARLEVVPKTFGGEGPEGKLTLRIGNDPDRLEEIFVDIPFYEISDWVNVIGCHVHFDPRYMAKSRDLFLCDKPYGSEEK